MKKDSSEVVPFIAKKYFSSNLDTSFYYKKNIEDNHRLSPRSESDFLVLGNLGSPLIPILYENKFYKSTTLGKHLIDDYFYREDNLPYFSLNKPLSELDFTFFGNGNEQFKGFLSQNLSSKVHIGLGLKRSTNKGFFLNQENQHNNLFAYAVYQSKTWRTNLEFIYNDASLKENGGYKTDIYNGIQPSLWGNYNSTLNGQSEFKNYQISWRNRFLISKTKVQNDSLIFIPIQSSFYLDLNFKFSSERQIYEDGLDSASRLEYGTYVNSNSTYIFSKYLNNQLSTESSLTYKDRQIKLKGYSSLAYNPVFHGFKTDTNITLNKYLQMNLGIDAQFQLTPKLSLEVNGYKGVSGYINQDFYLKSYFNWYIKKWNINTGIQYSHQLPPISYQYSFNSILNQTFSLKTEKILESKIELTNMNQGLRARVQYFQMDDFLTFDSIGQPIQLQNNFVQLYIRKQWSWKKLHFPTTIMIQNSIFKRSFLIQTLAFQNRFFNDKNNVYLGADLSLNYSNTQAQWSEYLMQPLFKKIMPESRLYPKVDLFATLKISKVHISFVFDNALSTYLQSGTSYISDYPITPSSFYFRANWVFLE